jgi:hypothetical protein
VAVRKETIKQQFNEALPVARGAGAAGTVSATAAPSLPVSGG